MSETGAEQRFDAIFPGCCQAALSGLKASGLGRDPVVVRESIRIGRLQAAAIVVEQDAIRVERQSARIEAEKQAKADAAREKQAEADERVRQSGYKKRTEQKAKQAVYDKKHAARVPGAEKGGR